MKKKVLLVVLLILISFALFVFAFWRVSDMLCYAEGWNTFYYNEHYIIDSIRSGMMTSLIEGFFLQFFHKPLHGIIIMSLLFVALEAILFVFFRNIKVKLLSYAIPFAIITFLVICTASSLSKSSFLNVLGFGGANETATMMYEKLSCKERDLDWDGILELEASRMPEANLLNQNIINMAMAEKGMLHEHLYDNPCGDINSIYVNDVQSEHVAALLSDIYYSMGHMAQAQRYAFEANEKMDNKSPRLLQRLIKTNIIYGQYAVARKYLRMLSDAIYYEEWCEYYGKLLDDASVEADRELSEKRLCLNIKNKFSGFNGLDKDLLMVARATKGHKQSLTTVQYLSALYRLAGYDKEYLSLLKEFHLKAQ